MGKVGWSQGNAQRGDGLPACRSAIHAAHLSGRHVVKTMARAEPVGTEFLQRRAWAAAASVPDPEVPCVTVADLGILRSVEIDDDGVAVAKVTPTYSGCPAVLAIELSVESALREAGFE